MKATEKYINKKSRILSSQIVLLIFMYSENILWYILYSFKNLFWNLAEESLLLLRIIKFYDSVFNLFRKSSYNFVVIVVQSLSHVWLFVTSWTEAHQDPLSFTISQSLLKLMSVELMMLSNHLMLCCPILLLPSSFPSIRGFSNELALHIRWPEYLASASVLPVNIQGWFPLGLTGLISLQSKGLPRVFSSTAVWKHQFFGAQPSLWPSSHISTWLLESRVPCFTSQSCLALGDSVDCSLPGSPVLGVFQEKP